MLQNMLRSPIFRFGPADLCLPPHSTPALQLLGENKEPQGLLVDRRGKVFRSGGDVSVRSEGRRSA